MAEKKLDVIVRALDQTVPGFRSARSQVQEFATETKKLLAEAFAFEKIAEGVKDFFKGSFEKSGEAERAWTQLSNTVANIGLSFEKVRPEVDAAVKSVQQITNVRTDEAIKGFDRLVSITGDYKKSLANMTLVADVAARKQIDFSEAAQLVGRVMSGTGARVLKEFGIHTKDATLATEELRAKLKGSAETELKTFEGQLKNIQAAFGDVQEAFGDTIAHNSALRQMFTDLANGLRSLAHWIDANKTDFAVWAASVIASFRAIGGSMVDLVGVVYYGGAAIALAATSHFKEAWEAVGQTGRAVKDLGKQWTDAVGAVEVATDAEVEGRKRSTEELKKNAAAMKALKDEEAAAAREIAQKKIETALDQRIQLLEKAGTLTQFHGQALTALHHIEDKTNIALKNTNLSMERRLQLEDRLAKIRDARVKLKDETLHQAGAITDARYAEMAREDMATFRPDQQRGAEESASLSIRASIANAGGSKRFVRGLGPDGLPTVGVADQLAQKFDKMGESIGKGNDGLMSMGSLLSDLVVGPVGAFGEAIGGAMAAMVTGSGKAGEAFRQTMLRALSQVAKHWGDYFEGRALGSLAEVFGGNVAALGAVAEWQLAAASMYALSGATGGMGGRGGGGGAGYGPGNYPGQNGQFSNQGDATLVIQGGLLDMSDPRQEQALAGALQKLSGRRVIVVSG